MSAVFYSLCLQLPSYLKASIFDAQCPVFHFVPVSSFVAQFLPCFRSFGGASLLFRKTEKKRLACDSNLMQTGTRASVGHVADAVSMSEPNQLTNPISVHSSSPIKLALSKFLSANKVPTAHPDDWLTTVQHGFDLQA